MRKPLQWPLVFAWGFLIQRGFLFACAYVQPDRKIASVKPESARKKLKDKSFARGVNRGDIIQGASELGAELDAHIRFVREALVSRAEELGL